MGIGRELFTWRVGPAMRVFGYDGWFCTYIYYISADGNAIPNWPLPAVRDLARDGRWSTYDVSVLNLSNASFRGKWAGMENSLNIPSPTKLARLGHVLPASQAGRHAGPVFYIMYTVCLFSGKCYQLAAEQPLSRQMVRSGKADGTNRLSQYKSSLQGHTPPAKLGRTPCMASPPW